MSHRLLAPHEEELEAMIRRLEPAAFQKFVENYAQIRWPNRFASPPVTCPSRRLAVAANNGISALS